MTENLASTNSILTIVAIATVVQAVVAVGAVIAASCSTRRRRGRTRSPASDRQPDRRLERQMAPLLARVDYALGESSAWTQPSIG